MGETELSHHIFFNSHKLLRSKEDQGEVISIFRPQNCFANSEKTTSNLGNVR